MTERTIIDSVTVATGRRRVSATVVLRRGDRGVEATASGGGQPAARWRTVAEAAIAALRQLEPAAEQVTIESAGVQSIGDRELGIAMLVLAVGADDELLAGVAPVRGDRQAEAVARAVLDATNRRLARVR